MYLMVVYRKVVSVAQQLLHDLQMPAKDVYYSFKAIVYMRCVVHMRAPCTVNSVTLLFTVVCSAQLMYIT